MINLLIEITVLTTTFSMFPYFFIVVFLTYKLRKKKEYMTTAIAGFAPKKIKVRMLFVMHAHMSWIAGSSIGYIWFSYLTLRYHRKIPRSEIIAWRIGIKKVLGCEYGLYWLSTLLGNIFFTGVFIFILIFILNESLFSGLL